MDAQYSAAPVFTLVKVKRSMWLMLLQAKQQQEMFVQQTSLEVKNHHPRYC